MNTIKITNSFTIVAFVLFSCLSLDAWAQTTTTTQTREDCESRARSTANTQCTGTRANGQTFQDCVAEKEAQQINALNCDRLQSRADRDSARNECTGLYNSYAEQNTRTAEECAEAGQASVPQCIATTNQCTGSFSATSGTDDNPIAGIMAIFSASSTVSGQSEECLIEDDEDRQDRLAERIQRLRDEQADTVIEQAELDNQIAEKDREIKEQIRVERQEINDAITDARNEGIQKAADIQKQILDARERKAKNLIQVNRKNTEIANLEFAQQQVAIEFSESKIARKCYDRVLETRNRLMARQTPAQAAAAAGQASAAQPAAPAQRFSLREISRIKKQLREEEDECLKVERLSRAAQMKGSVDRRSELTDDISELNAEITRDEERITIDRNSYEQEKTNLDAQERQKLAGIEEMEANLNNELAQFKATIERRKAALTEKINNREATITALMTQKANRRPRYAKVASSLAGRDESLSAFTTQCCDSSIPASSQNPNCRRLTRRGSERLVVPTTTTGGSRPTR